MKPKKGTASEKFVEMLDIFSSREANTVQRFLDLFDDQVFMFGTGSEEVSKGKEEVRKSIEREIAQVPEKWNYELKWIDEIQLNEKSTCINAEIKADYPVQNRILTFDPVRITAVYNLVDGQHLIASMHSSLTDESDEDEILPGSLEPKRYEEISVLFTDFVGFTNAASSIPAKKLVRELNELFVAFDDITNRHGLDKIKTIGDSYMAAGGLKNENSEHAVNCVDCAKEMIEFLQTRNQNSGIKWDVRAGIHTGTAVGGIIGKTKLRFDLWGDTINIASKLEGHSVANRINVSAYTYDLIREKYPCEYRGKVEIKGKGSIDMYFVE